MKISLGPHILVLAGALLFSAACLTEPYDQRRVPNRRSTISIAGYLNAGNQDVGIEAYNYSTGQFDNVRTVRTQSRSVYRADNTNFHPYNSSVSLSDDYWTAGYNGHEARLRARYGRYTLASVKRNWISCWGAQGESIAGFANHCTADGTPTARVQTSDYCPEDGRSEISSARAYIYYSGKSDIEVTLSIRGPHSYPAVKLVRGGVEFLSMSSHCRRVSGNGGAGVSSYLCRRSDPWSDCTLTELASWPSARLHVSYTTPGVCGGETNYERQLLLGSRACDADDLPPPPPMSAPDLRVNLGHFDGRNAPVTICNQGNRAVTTTNFSLEVNASSLVTPNEVSLQSYLPVGGLAAGQCHSIGELLAHGWGGAGGEAIPSAWVEVCVDSDNEVVELNEFNNCSRRNRTP